MKKTFSQYREELISAGSWQDIHFGSPLGKEVLDLLAITWQVARQNSGAALSISPDSVVIKRDRLDRIKIMLRNFLSLKHEAIIHDLFQTEEL